MIETLHGTFHFGQVIAALAASAFAPAGDQNLSRNCLDTVHHKSLITRGEFDPSAAAVAINKAIHGGEKSKSSLDSDKIASATYGPFPSAPMSTNYHGKELDLATFRLREERPPASVPRRPVRETRY